MVSLGPNGSILKQGAPSEVLQDDPALMEQARHEAELLELDEQETETTKEPEETKGGQLVIAEEIAIGRVSWQAGKASPWFAGSTG